MSVYMPLRLEDLLQEGYSDGAFWRRICNPTWQVSVDEAWCDTDSYKQVRLDDEHDIDPNQQNRVIRPRVMNLKHRAHEYLLDLTYAYDFDIHDEDAEEQMETYLGSKLDDSPSLVHYSCEFVRRAQAVFINKWSLDIKDLEGVTPPFLIQQSKNPNAVLDLLRAMEIRWTADIISTARYWLFIIIRADYLKFIGYLNFPMKRQEFWLYFVKHTTWNDVPFPENEGALKRPTIEHVFRFVLLGLNVDLYRPHLERAMAKLVDKMFERLATRRGVQFKAFDHEIYENFVEIMNEEYEYLPHDKCIR